MRSTAPTCTGPSMSSGSYHGGVLTGWASPKQILDSVLLCNSGNLSLFRFLFCEPSCFLPVLGFLDLKTRHFYNVSGCVRRTHAVRLLRTRAARQPSSCSGFGLYKSAALLVNGSLSPGRPDVFSEVWGLPVALGSQALTQAPKSPCGLGGGLLLSQEVLPWDNRLGPGPAASGKGSLGPR